MQIEITDVVCTTYGNCKKISNGIVEVLVTLDFGPRIIHFSRTGMENMFFNDTKKSGLGEKFDVYNGDIFKLYGGHRLWISPEINPRCYHPDNQPVKFEKIKDGGKFTAAVEAFNMIQKTIEITLEDDKPFVTVNHTIKNVGAWEIELAPWSITMLAEGAVGVMPMPSRKTGLLPNRSFVFWDYTDLSDERISFGKDYLTLKQIPGRNAAFKLGYNNEAGWAAYFNKKQLFIKSFDPDLEGIYPDGGCCFETYTNQNMLESETLGQISLLSPGDEISHAEEWELHAEENLPSDNEAEIRKLMSKYIK